jgi:hypothetical protein
MTPSREVETLRTASQRVQAAIHQASDLVRLADGWNSYRAKSVSPKAIHHATRFLREADSLISNLPAPSIVPTVRGGLQLEWHRQGVEIEIEFGVDDSASWYAEERGAGTALEGPVVGHENTIRQWLKRASV